MGLHAKPLTYLDMLTRSQRGQIDRQLLRYHRALAGREVLTLPYRVCSSAFVSDILFIDLQTEFEGVPRDFHVRLANRSAFPALEEGLRARGKPNCVLHDEKYIAATPLGWFP